MNDERRQPLLLQLQAKKIVPLSPDKLVVFAELNVHAAQLERALDANDELDGPSGLREEVVSTCAERTVEGVDVPQSGEKEDGRLGAPRERPDPLAHREAVYLGHANIQKNAVGPLLLERGDPFGSTSGQDDAIALVLERVLREQTVGLVVVDDEDRGGRGRVLGTRRRHECAPASLVGFMVIWWL